MSSIENLTDVEFAKAAPETHDVLQHDGKNWVPRRFRLYTKEVTASYTLTAADAGSSVRVNSAGAATVTVPANVFSAGDRVRIKQWGAGAVTIAAGSGLTLRDPNTRASIATQYDERVVEFISAAEAVIY